MLPLYQFLQLHFQHQSVFRSQWKWRLHLSLCHFFLTCYSIPSTKPVLGSVFLWESSLSQICHTSWHALWEILRVSGRSSQHSSWRIRPPPPSPSQETSHLLPWRSPRLHLLTHILVQSEVLFFPGRECEVYCILMQHVEKFKRISNGGKHLG